MLLARQTEKVRTRILLICWQAWNLRNDLIHGDGRGTVPGSVAFLRRHEEELSANLGVEESDRGKRCNTLFEEVTNHTLVVKANHWTKPAEGIVKLNTDAAYYQESGDSWAGGVARDSQGRVLISFCKNVGVRASVEEAEASAVLIGLQELLRIYKGPLVVEIDCAVLGKELLAGPLQRSACFSLITDIKSCLQLFPYHQFSIVKRECNSLAHGLAGMAKISGDTLMIGKVPDPLERLWLRDCNPNHE